MSKPTESNVQAEFTEVEIHNMRIRSGTCPYCLEEMEELNDEFFSHYCRKCGGLFE